MVSLRVCVGIFFSDERRRTNSFLGNFGFSLVVISGQECVGRCADLSGVVFDDINPE